MIKNKKLTTLFLIIFMVIALLGAVIALLYMGNSVGGANDGNGIGGANDIIKPTISEQAKKELEADKLPGIEHFKDPDWARNFSLRTKVGNLRTLEFKPSAEKPLWDIGQNDSKFEIYGSPLVTTDDGGLEYRNEGKLMRLYQDGTDTALRLEVYGDKEYDRPRQDGEPWPHLLVGTSLGDPATPIVEYTQLRYSMDVKINYCDNKMGDVYDPNRGWCAQTTAYMTLQNLNKESPGYGDYIWFGVPIFDSRCEFPGAFTLLDEGGKHDATGKSIYVMGDKEFLENNYAGVNPKDGEWAHCTVNVLPHALTALKVAQLQGHMKNTKVEDLYLGGFNIGWEVTGTFNCSMDLKNISLKGITE